MSRHLLIVMLLATGVVMADDAPGTGPDPNAAEAAAEAGTEPDPHAAGAAAQTGAEASPGDTAEKGRNDKGPKLLPGMSILGNQDAPKSLVIVPWRSSVIGDSLGIAPMLDASRQPVDKDVFMRALSYYEIRSGRK